MEVVPLLPYLLSLLGLLGLSGFFSGSETALCALTRVQIERLRLKKRGATAIVNFVDNPRRLFITVLLGNNLVNVAFAILMLWVIRRVLPHPAYTEVIQLAAATTLSVLLMLIFGELAPKTFAIKYAEPFASWTAPPLWGFSIVITPVRAVLRKIIDFLAPIFGGNFAPREQLTAADFQNIVDTYHEEALPPDEREIVMNILQLRDIEAKEIMVPRTAVIAVPTSETLQATLTRAKESGFSRIPVYQEQIDNICGIFYVKDLPQWRHLELETLTLEAFLAMQEAQLSPPSAPLIREPIRVPETRKIGMVLPQLAREKTKMAILLDEYGGVSGIVTTEDIIEQVVGDIVDEHDMPAEFLYIQHTEEPLALETSGRVSVRELNQQFGLKLSEEGADTIGGYAFGLFGRIPAIGESSVDDNGLEFEIADIEGNFITRLFIRAKGAQS